MGNPSKIIWMTQHRKLVLGEAYLTPEDPTEHKRTAHCQKWYETVTAMMAELRRINKYCKILFISYLKILIR